MNIENLKYFIKVMDEKSISKAAQSEHLTQSAMTQVIKKLEDECACSLLDRSNKGITPTECGLLVYEYAKSIVSTFGSMKSRLSCMTEGCYSIVIKPCCSMDNYVLPKALFSIQNQFENIKLDVMIGNKAKIIEEIKIGITDFGFVMGETPIDPLIDAEIVGHERIVLIAGHDIPIQDEICLCDLERYKLIEFSLGSYGKEIKRKIESHVKKDQSKLTYEPFFSIDSLTAIKSLVESHFGIAFLPYYTVSEDLDKGKFRIIDVKNFSVEMPIKVLSKTTDQLLPLLFEIRKLLVKETKTLFKHKNNHLL
jgi:LysR family transcriptional regulator, transcriptional activator of the cysJI operon